MLIFGFFFWDSFHDGSGDPTKIVLSGADTLGRDWGAIAEKKVTDEIDPNAIVTPTELQSYGDIDAGTIKSATKLDINPLEVDKNASYNYTSVPSPDGREIITGVDNSDEENNRYRSRHEIERQQDRENSRP